MNLYIIDGHVSHSGERGWLRTDQFLKVPKTQNRWYGLHPAPNPVDTRPGKVVKFWSNDAPHLNSSCSRIAKPSGLTVTPPPSRPIAQDTLRKWRAVFTPLFIIVSYVNTCNFNGLKTNKTRFPNFIFHFSLFLLCGYNNDCSSNHP